MAQGVKTDEECKRMRREFGELIGAVDLRIACLITLGSADGGDWYFHVKGNGKSNNLSNNNIRWKRV